MEAGYARLNCLTIIQASQGLAQYLMKEASNAAESGIVVGYDARHNSRKFAELTMAAFIAKGIKVWWFEDLVHTPLVPFGVLLHKAAAGVMITASHNPAQDNGYKVYNSKGCQINSPVDGHITRAILENLEPVTWNIPEHSSLKEAVLSKSKECYVERIFKELGSFPRQLTPAVRFVYTPMHGVGLQYLQLALKRIGIDGMMAVVEEQARPNPDFPTVKYPNPEEEGALELAINTANSQGIKLILANDPDADRFSAAEKTIYGWHQFTGDQMGVLLAYYWITQQDRQSLSQNIILTSAVSSQMLSVIASKHGFTVKETLTGFKWLGSVALDLMGKGLEVPFGYEEALGYMIPSIILDKDGIAASVLFLKTCAEWSSPWAMLQRLYAQYGYFETANTYWRSSSTSSIDTVFANVRRLGDPYPISVGNRKVIRWRDLTVGYDSATPDRVPDLPCSAESHMITCWLEGSSRDQGVRFTVRTSGTEPKIKSKD